MNTLTNLIVRTGDDGTFGLFQTPTRIYRSGQLPWRNNQSDISCIPEGTYTAKWQWSPKHNCNKYHLVDVPGREVIEIHVGDYCGDTTQGYRSDVLGCIILGLGETDTIWDGKKQHILDQSIPAISAFETEMNGEDFMLTVKCQLGVGPFVVS